MTEDRVHVYPIDAIAFDASVLGPDVPESDHVTSDAGLCWCQPRVEAAGIGYVVVHRRTLDSPIEEPE